jgi:hypothetical protein
MVPPPTPGSAATQSPPTETIVDGVRTIHVPLRRTPNRVRDTAELILSRLGAIPPRVRAAVAGIAGVAVVALLVMVVLHPFDASNANRQASAHATSTLSPTVLVNTFFRAVRDPQAGFHVVVTGDAEMTGGATTRGTLRASIQARGDDLSGELSSTPAVPASTTFDGLITRSGGRSWVRPAGATAWKVQPLPAVTDVLNPFAWLASADEVSFAREGTSSGDHRSFTLQIAKWLNGTQYDALVATLTDVDREGTMEVEVDQDGIPIHGTYRYTIHGTGHTGGKVSVTGMVDYTFDSWGQVGPIGPPS